MRRVIKEVCEFVPSSRSSRRSCWASPFWTSRMRFLDLIFTVYCFIFRSLFKETHTCVVFLWYFIKLIRSWSSSSQKVLLSKSLHVLNISIMKSFLRWAKSKWLYHIKSLYIILLLLYQLLLSKLFLFFCSFNVHHVNVSLYLLLFLK